MPVATITSIHCVQPATAVDIEVDTALAELLARIPEVFLPGELGDVPAEAIRSVPGLIATVDGAQANPDNLYVTAVTNAGRENAIWPAPGVDVEIAVDQPVAPNVSVNFVSSQNISLFDEDSVSRDDLLGSITIFAHEQGQGEFSRLAR